MKKEKSNSNNNESIIFQEITNYYYQHLSTNADALNILKGHGLLNSRIVHQFKIGYVDGSLLNILQFHHHSKKE